MGPEERLFRSRQIWPVYTIFVISVIVAVTLILASRYPANPNGSPSGIAGLTSRDGRSTLLMPHPERVHRSVQMSWHPADWGEDSPWQRMFVNARSWV